MKIARKKYSEGMSIIEVIISISVFVLVAGVLFASVTYFYRTNKYSIDQAFAIEEARRGVELMTRDIREATYSDEGSYPIISAGPNSFYFYSDTDRDSNVERIRFFLEGSMFKRAVTKSSGDPLVYDDANETVSIISDNVRNAEQDVDIFSYYDSAGVEITDLSNIMDIAFVKVNLIVNADNNRKPNEFTLRSSATLRNLKTNL